MGNWKRKGLILTLALALALPAATALGAGADKTTKYRMYQYDQAVKEFSTYNEAVNFARYYSNSRVEEIGTGAWKWDNYPQYEVYHLGQLVPGGSFEKLTDAIKEASKWKQASIRDVESTGWVWNNYPRYQVYQGDISQPDWAFTSWNAAVDEAKKWSGSHIIDLSDNRWVWDNLSAADKQGLRSGAPAYQLYQGTYTEDSWQFPYLEDAIIMSFYWSNSTVVRIADKETVYTNLKQYKVYQNENFVEEFVSLDQAADYARQFTHASVRLNGQKIWHNYAPYSVYQGSALIGEYFSISDALYYASHYSNAFVSRWDGKSLWNNFHKLQVWGWNGSSSKETIANHTASVMGLDVDSPTWFILEDATGTLKDTSNKEAVEMLKKRGLQVHPLVGNQFDSALTSQFLADQEAQNRFITALVTKSAQLQVDGINIDFESLNGKDRAAFTAFIAKLTAAAHEKQLRVSVDLPRGSVKWNHLTAFDHEKLGGIADYIITMAYDQHYSGSTVAGSVAGLDWVEEGIKEFLSYGIPRDKLILGIPFYVREWTLDSKGALASNKALYSKDLPALMAKRATVSTWDAAAGQYKVEYTGDDGLKRVFWLENANTVQARMALAKKYQLAGVAAWRLGQEDPAFWETILQNK
jgi:spore germination protein YaaH